MDVNNLLEELAPLVKEYEENKKQRMDTGFNVFYLISDYYYRETFHDDILYALLSPEEKHGEGNLFVHLFIDMINKVESLKNKVDKKNYGKVSVKKQYGTNDGNERGRIDLLIIGEDNHCIVIENKLNNAPDTTHQLPKYRNDLEVVKGNTIDAYVYIPLDQNKKPDKSDWKEDEKQDIDQKLVVIPAFKIGSTSLVKDWLDPAENIAKNDDARFIIKQYKTLLNNLTIDIMDNETIVNTLVKTENFDTTMAIMENYDAICNRIIKEFVNELHDRVQREAIGKMNCSSNNTKIEISFFKTPDWSYVIECYTRTNQYWRYWVYSGEKKLPMDIKKLLPKELPNCPLGWDYFEEDKRWCYWNQANTLRAMKDGSFVEFIIDELNDSTKRIHELGL